MESDYDYKEVAATVIHRFGGSERVKRMFVISGKYFYEFSLPDMIGKCFQTQHLPDRDAVYNHILEILMGEGKPDIYQILLDMKEQLDGMTEKVDNALFYFRR